MIETDLGLQIDFGEYRLFFGARAANVTNLKPAYPDLNFIRAKQVHGNVIHEVSLRSPDLTLEGDGLLTEDPGLALCSITADCTPVLIAALGTPWIAAFHAGWRGVASRIIPKGIQELMARGADPERMRIWIGPHILQNSFEVHADVRDQILRSRPPENATGKVSEWGNGPVTESESVCIAGNTPDVFNISLVGILLEQIGAAGVSLENVEMELRDTKTDPHFHSARRDRAKSGRQVSWIARLK